MNRIKAASVCGVLAFALAASGLAGCGKVNGAETAITVNGEDLSVGTANFWLRYQQASTYSMMVSYGFASDDIWDSDMSASSSSSSGSDEAKSYGETMKDSYTEEIEENMLLRQHAADYGVTIPEDLQTQIADAASAAMEANGDAFKKMGVSEENVTELLELLTYRTLMFDPMTEDTDREVSDEEAAQTTVSYVRFSLTPKDDSGSSVPATDEQKDTWKQELLAMIAAAKETGDPATADLSAIKDEIDEDGFAFSYSFGKDDTSLQDEVKEAVKGLSDGEFYDGVIETEDFYYIVRLDAAFDEAKTETKRASIISEREHANFDDKIAAWLDEAEITVSDAWKELKVTDAEPYELAPQTTEG